jgi:hypothetical protein
MAHKLTAPVPSVDVCCFAVSQEGQPSGQPTPGLEVLVGDLSVHPSARAAQKPHEGSFGTLQALNLDLAGNELNKAAVEGFVPLPFGVLLGAQKRPPRVAEELRSPVDAVGSAYAGQLAQEVHRR